MRAWSELRRAGVHPHHRGDSGVNWRAQESTPAEQEGVHPHHTGGSGVNLGGQVSTSITDESGVNWGEGEQESTPITDKRVE